MKHSTFPRATTLLVFCYVAMVMGNKNEDSTNGVTITTATSSTSHLRTSLSSSLSSSTTSSASSHALSTTRTSSISKNTMDGDTRRELSMWASFLSFVKCPPGPLGAHCRPDGTESGGGGGSSGGGSSGSSNNSGSSGSSGSSNNSGRSSGSSSSNNGTSSNSSNSSSSSSSSNNNNNNNNNVGAEDSSGNVNERNYKGTAASAVFKSGWLMILGGLAMVGLVVGAVVYSKSRASAGAQQAEGGTGKAERYHELTGAVKKRNKAFREAMRLKLGWRKGRGNSSSGLTESLA